MAKGHYVFSYNHMERYDIATNSDGQVVRELEVQSSVV